MKPVLLAAAALLAGAAGVAQAADLPSAAPADVGLSAERLARIGTFIEGEIEAGRKAGAVVLVTRHGQVAYHESFGMADLDSRRPMTTETLVRLYSMTKPVTSVALLTLFEQGRFLLTDPLEDYLPEFRDIEVFAGVDSDGSFLTVPAARPPTIQDVFRHTAGFGYGSSEHPVDRAYTEAGIGYGTSSSIEELVGRLARIPLMYQPGAEWIYSFAHDVQARLVEVLSGRDYADYVRETILEPLGMTDAVFGVPPEYVPRYATNYGPDEYGEGLVVIETARGTPPGSDRYGTAYGRHGDVPFGGSSLSGTAMDYARFAQMLVNGGELDGVRILGEKTVALMRANHLPDSIPSIGLFGNGGLGYGLGVSSTIDRSKTGTLASVGNFGWGGAATTLVTMDPTEEIVIIALTQYMPVDRPFRFLVENLVYQAIVD